MERNWNLNEVSDGKLYNANDMVKAGCNDCKGCSACCHGMGTSIVLDPFDIWQLTTGLNMSVEELFVQALELNVVEGVILPNLKMQESTSACYFLNEEGRCRIHAIRPGICRIFPLGRLYEQEAFQYFLQVNECKAVHKTKVKIKHWIDIPDYKRYEAFVSDWHYFLKHYQEQAEQGILGENELKTLNLNILNVCYLEPYESDADFYQQYEQRKARVKLSAEGLQGTKQPSDMINV